MRLALAVTAFVLLTPLAGAADVASSPADEVQAVAAASSCAPPCGEINPRILFEFEELTRDPVDTSAGDQIVFDGTVTYWFDADDEGYVPPDPQTPIVIQFTFPRMPAWAQMSIEPATIEVETIACPECPQASADDPTRPQLHWEYTEPVTMTIDVLDVPEPTPGYDYGKLQVFAKSTESGIYNPGYGIREVRIATDGALEANSLGDDGNGVPGPSALALLSTLGISAAVVALKRRA